MYKLTIRRYHALGGNVQIVVDIPQRVTITGKEDHFRRAYEDADMVIRGMAELDEALGQADGVIYDITSIVRC